MIDKKASGVVFKQGGPLGIHLLQGSTTTRREPNLIAIWGIGT